MSIINGIVRFDGQTTEKDLRRMVNAGRFCCPDGAGVWSGGNAALGLNLLQTLPAARSVSAPFHDPSSGLTVTAGVRIDNRTDLCNKLDVHQNGHVSDAELILRAYRKWNEGCVEHLIGDFAFAVWDERERKLFCARDIFGVIPFFYFRSAKTFIFSGAVFPLLTIEEIPRNLNEEYIADKLAGLYCEDDKTVYREISSLLPAHCMAVKEGGISLRRYWKPESGYPIRFSREEEYVERYRELFTEAVSCRLATDGGGVASLLSGGLDSGSIAAVAGPLLARNNRFLSSYSFVLAEDQRTFFRDEKELVTLLHGMEGIKGHFITTRDFTGEPYSLYDKPYNYLPLCSSPHLDVLFGKLRGEKIKTLLDGYGGDQCATCSSQIPLWEFLPGFQATRFMRYIRAASVGSGRSVPRVVWSLVKACFRQTNGNDINELVFSRSALAIKFRERMGIQDRARKNIFFQQEKCRSLPEVMMRRLLTVGKGFEITELFIRNNVERRFPMLDKRLVEFCLAVPSEQHHYDMNRRMMRRAMQEKLRDEVRLRNNKDINNAPGHLFFVHENREYFISIIKAAKANDHVMEYIDVEKLQKRFEIDLPEEIEKGAQGAFMPGPTLRGFLMLLFLQNHFAK